MDKKKEKTILILIILLALILRSVKFFSQPLWPDEALYLQVAKNLYMHGSLTFNNSPWIYQPPLFIFLIAFFSFFFGSFYAVIIARLLTLGFAIMYLVGTYLLAKHLYGEETALFSTFFLAITPVSVFFSRMIVADNLLVVSLIFTIFFFLKYLDERNQKHAYFSGILIGLTALSKKIGILIYPTLIMYLILREKNFSWFKRKDIILVFLISLLIQLPWYLRNYMIFKNPIIKKELYLYTPSVANRNFPLAFLTLLFHLNLPVFLLAVFGAIIQEKKDVYKIGVPLLIFLPIIFFFSRFENHPRYLLPLLPFVSILGAYGMRKFRKYNLLMFLLITFIFIFGVYFSLLTIESNASEYVGYREVSQWLNENIGKNAIIFTNSRVIKYYSEIDCTFFPENEENLWKIIDNYDKAYIIISKWPTDPRTPAYAFRLPEKYDNKVFSFSNKERKEIISVYRLK